MVAWPKPHYSKSEYVKLENESPIKHEHINGEIYPVGEGGPTAMAGGSPNHSRLAGRTYSILDAQLRGKPCEPFNSDTRVEVLETEATFYPDVLVACPPLAYSPDDGYALTNPVVLIEVLSPSTEQHDRGAKWAHYQQLPSLRDYLLIAQDKMRLEHYARQSDNSWLLRVYEQAAEVVTLTGVECRLTLEEIYERVQFDEPEA